MQRENVANPPPNPTPWRRLQDTYLRATVLLYEALRTTIKPRPTRPAAPPPPTPKNPLREKSRQNPMHLYAPAPTPTPRPSSQRKLTTPPTGLRNNNPRGDPNTAPRCGAHTRAGNPCRSPAMPNGRCRMHGGHSTGPRTIEGLNRLRAAATKHGAYATSAARRFKDPNDPFFRQSLRSVLLGTRATIALISRSGPNGPDPSALLALMTPDPIPIRRRKPAQPAARVVPG